MSKRRELDRFDREASWQRAYAGVCSVRDYLARHYDSRYGGPATDIVEALDEVYEKLVDLHKCYDAGSDELAEG